MGGYIYGDIIFPGLPRGVKIIHQCTKITLILMMMMMVMVQIMMIPGKIEAFQRGMAWAPGILGVCYQEKDRNQTRQRSPPRGVGSV